MGGRPRAALSFDDPYYHSARLELVEFIMQTAGAPAGRALDIGCAAGAMGRLLREAGWEVWGCEPDARAASEAAASLDRVIAGSFPESEEVRDGVPFELIVFADSLEHLADPWTALDRARELLAPGGAVVVSVPNVSHWSVIRDLVRGRWDYSDAGLLDRTHLRFFTPATIRAALEGAGFVVSAEHRVTGSTRRRFAPIAWVMEWALPHMLTYQDYIAARVPPP